MRAGLWNEAQGLRLSVDCRTIISGAVAVGRSPVSTIPRTVTMSAYTCFGYGLALLLLASLLVLRIMFATIWLFVPGHDCCYSLLSHDTDLLSYRLSG